MGKASKFIVAVLSAVMIFIISSQAGFLADLTGVRMKPHILYEPQADAAYDLCDAAREMIQESVVMYTGSPAALVNGLPARISAHEPLAAPIIRDNEIFVPAAFLARSLGARFLLYGETAAITIFSGHNTISFTAGQNRLSVNGTQVFLPYPAFYEHGEIYIHLTSICEILGKSVSCSGDIIMVNTIGRSIDLSEDEHTVNDLLYYFSGGRISSREKSHFEPAVSVSAAHPHENKDIKLYINQDEIDLYAFPITEIDPDASAHDHGFIIQDNVVMAPVVLMRLLDFEVFESVKPNVISQLEAAPFGKYTGLTLKPGSSHAYLNLHGAFKDRLVVLPSAPRLINSHLYVPIAAISGLFGVRADWHEKSCTLRLSSLASPRFPNLRWAPRKIQSIKAPYELKMSVRLKDAGGNDLQRVDCVSKGSYDSGEYTGRAAVGISSEASCPWDSDALYDIKRFLNQDSEYQYSLRRLKPLIHQTGFPGEIDFEEILMTDIEYLRRKVEFLTDHFHASDLLKKQPDVSIRGKTVDKYTFELYDMPSIIELFGIRRIPGLHTRKLLHDREEDYIFELLRIELAIDKAGDAISCSLSLRGKKKNEKHTASHDSDNCSSGTPFELSINADFF